MIAQQVVSKTRARNLDFEFMQSIITEPLTPEFNGFNTKVKRESKGEVKPRTVTMHTPLVDMVPHDPTTMMTAMVEAQHLTSAAGQAITVFTCDQQLYRVALNISWTYPE